MRHDLPKIGGVKLWKKLNDNGISVGRDELYSWLQRYDLLVKYKKKYVVTTDSSKWLRQFSNLVKNKEVTKANQVWVSDITYIETQKGFVYLSLITDVYSRRIMGWHIHDSLDTQGPLNALYRAFLNIDKTNLSELIHHSDRGCQYCSSNYVNTLRMRNIKISTTQDGSPYDNAIAERVNGILKKEWLDDCNFSNITEVREKVENIVQIYNNQRPHMSLKMETPNTAYVDTTGKFAYTIY